MISGKLESDGIWNTPKYYEVKPTHAVSRMKLAVNAVVKKGLKTHVWLVYQIFGVN